MVGGRTTTGIELERQGAELGVLGREDRDKQSSGAIVLVLSDDRPGGAEEDLEGETLWFRLDLKLRRGGERRLLSLTAAGEGGGEPV